MKHLILLAFILTSQAGFAQTCEPGSKEMAQYFSQKNWTASTIPGKDDVPAINGFVDTDGRFYIGDLTRSGKFSAQLTVDPSNKSYKDFFNYCQNYDSKGVYLQTMRHGRENNKYTVTLRYLPEITGFKNQPLVDQAYQENSVDVTLKFDDQSLISLHEYFPDSVKASIYKNIKKQITDQTQPGLITLDLTGLDDVVCDLVQGHVTLGVTKGATSTSALVQQKKIVEPADLQNYYAALKDSVTPALSKENAIYVAARTQAKLEQDHRITSYGDKKGFEILKNLMDPTLSKVADLDAQALNCVSDRMQSYERSATTHFFNIQFKLPTMDQLISNLGGKP